MPESPARRAALQRRIDRLSQPRAATGAGVAPLGAEAIDLALGGGLARARLHEIVAGDAADAASAAGFAAMCAQRIGGPLGWLGVGTRMGTLHAHGLHAIGIDLHRLMLVSAPDPPALLRAADDAMRCTALGAVVIELWRDPQRIDLTVSRRLLLAAETSGVTALLLRIAAKPVASAAQTRWSVSAAPSRPLPANAPGSPTLDIELTRQRGGPAGMRWRVEWNREEACLRAPLCGTEPAVPAGRSPAVEPGGRRYAAAG